MSDRLQEAASGKTGPKKGFGAWIAGRSRRREYWTWVGPAFAAAVVLAILVPGLEIVLGPVILLAWIRRLHDLGLSGWIAPLVNIAIAVIGWLEVGVMSPGGDGGLFSGVASLVALVVMGLLPGQPRANAYGGPPGKASEAAEVFS